MKVLGINNIAIWHAQYKHAENRKHGNIAEYSPAVQTQKLPSYNTAISFCGISHGGDKLKKLVRYGITDFYTGQPLLDPKTLEYLQYKNIFSKPIKELIIYLKPYEDTLIATGKEFFELVKETAKTKPNITLSDVVKLNREKHEKELVECQRKIFCKLTYMAANLPKELHKDFSVLTNINKQRYKGEEVTLPFSETEFLYKLKRIYEIIKSQNNKKEISAMKEIQKMATKLFKGNNSYNASLYPQSHLTLKQRIKKQGIVKATLRKKLEHQMKPEVLKKNADNLEEIRKYYESTVLKNNPKLDKLFDDTNAKIHGNPFYAKFERQSFLYELKKITKQLKDRNYAHKLMNKAAELPTSYENLSAFIVKYSEDSSQDIGYNMMKDSLVSIDHFVAKKNGGPNTIRNFVLCSVGINREKSNIPFAEFLKKHPETYENCQKQAKRLIELCNEGIFDKLEIPQSYISDFANMVYKGSPSKNKINIDTSGLKKS